MMSLKLINMTVWLLSHNLNYLSCPSGKISDRNIRGKGLILAHGIKGYSREGKVVGLTQVWICQILWYSSLTSLRVWKQRAQARSVVDYSP